MQGSTSEWFGYIERRDSDYVAKRMLRLELQGKSPRGRPKRSFIDVVKKVMRVVGVSDKDTEDRVIWRWMICRGNPKRERSKEDCYRSMITISAVD